MLPLLPPTLMPAAAEDDDDDVRSAAGWSRGGAGISDGTGRDGPNDDRCDVTCRQRSVLVQMTAGTKHDCQILMYPPITYYWTVPLILDYAYLVGKLTSSKIADTKVSGF
jgi:hypothetical protein